MDGAGRGGAFPGTTAGAGRGTTESRGTRSSTGNAGSSERANATVKVSPKLPPADQVSRTPAMLLPAAPAVVLAV